VIVNSTISSSGTQDNNRVDVDMSTGSPNSVSITDTVFIKCGTFLFASGQTITGNTFNNCEQISPGGADMRDCSIVGYEGATGTGALSYNVSGDPDGELDGIYFEKGTSPTHAIQFGTSAPTTMYLRNIEFSGYNASDQQNDSTLYFADTGGTITLNLVGCSGNVSVKTAGCTVNKVINPVTTLVTVKDNSTKAVLAGAAVTIFASDGTGPLPYQDSVTITQTGGTATVSHTAHGLNTNQKVLIVGANEAGYNGIKTITKINDDSYSYSCDSGLSSPATGTITATAVVIDGLTDTNGQISDSRSLSGDQPIVGYAQSGSGVIPYVPSDIINEIDSTNGINISILLNRDT